MSGRNFTQALHEAEAARSKRSLSPQAERRIRERLEGAHVRQQRWSPVLTLAGAVATVCVLLVAYSLLRPHLEPAPVASELRGFVADTASDPAHPAPPSALRIEGDHVVATAPAKVFDPASRIHVEAQPGAAFAHDPRGLRVMSGTVELAVNKRLKGEAPAAVLVSDGAIEILGTRFTVVQHADGGEVTLHEGRIQFVANDGRTVILHPGDSLRWPLPAPVAQNDAPTPVAPPAVIPQTQTPSPVPVEKPAARNPGKLHPHVGGALQGNPRPLTPAFNVEAFIDQLNVLRRRGQFAEAAARLEGALKKDLPEATSERLSYELGDILTRQLKDPARACQVWTNLRTQHPNGRYATEVKRATEELGCP